jgi:thiol-disulfide isomerase/thioredoxin
MRNRQSLTKLLMFLLPAIITVAAYTTFYDSLFGTPKCENCDKLAQSSPQHNAFDLRRILDLIDQLRQNLAAKEAHLKYAQRTPLDLAFLKDKLDTFGNQTGLSNDLESGINQKVDDFLLQEKPLVIAKIDEENFQEKFKDPVDRPEDYPPITPPSSPNPFPLPLTGPTGGITDCSVNNPCLPPPCPQNTQCPLDPVDPTSPGNGGSSAVPLPTSAYFLLSGLFIVFIARFRRRST